MVVNKQHLSLNPLKSTNHFLISENATLLPLLLFSTFLDFYCLFLNFPFFPPFHLILSEAVPLIYIKMRLYRIYHLYSVGSFPSSRFFFFKVEHKCTVIFWESATPVLGHSNTFYKYNLQN